MYIEEILQYDVSYYQILQKAGFLDEDVQPFLEWAFGKVVSFDKRQWARKWNRFHGKHLKIDKTPESTDEWLALGRVWSLFKSGLLK